MDLVENDQRQDLTDTRYRTQQNQAVFIRTFGVFQDMPFDLAELLVVEVDEVQIQLDAFLHAGI